MFHNLVVEKMQFGKSFATLCIVFFHSVQETDAWFQIQIHRSCIAQINKFRKIFEYLIEWQTSMHHMMPLVNSLQAFYSIDQNMTSISYGNPTQLLILILHTAIQRFLHHNRLISLYIAVRSKPSQINSG